MDGQQLSSDVSSVAVELELSVGADVEGAVPTVSDEAVADGCVLNAFEREAPVLHANIFAEDRARPLDVEATRVVDRGEVAIHERLDAIPVKEPLEFKFCDLVHLGGSLL